MRGSKRRCQSPYHRCKVNHMLKRKFHFQVDFLIKIVFLFATRPPVNKSAVSCARFCFRRRARTRRYDKWSQFTFRSFRSFMYYIFFLSISSWTRNNVLTRKILFSFLPYCPFRCNVPDVHASCPIDWYARDSYLFCFLRSMFRRIELMKMDGESSSGNNKCGGGGMYDVLNTIRL